MKHEQVVQHIRRSHEEKLRVLNLSYEELTELPPEIGELKDLKELYLSNSQLTGLPLEIGKLKNLEKLNLSNNHLTQLPSKIGELTNLKVLYLSNNQLTQLPPEMGRLKNLKELYLFSNKLAKIPPEIGELTNLKILSLFSNQLIEIPPEIGKLTNLEKFNLSNNHLTQLPSKIGELTNLKEFNLSDSQLTQLPPEIGGLTNLRELNLSNSQLTQLSPEIGKLKNLENLNLINNHLTQLPLEITQLKKLMTFYIFNNPLSLPPPEIVSRGLKAIFTYLNQSINTENNEAKLILVGSGGVGKTCLAYRLMNNDFLKDSKITEGINISKWEISAPGSENSEIKLNIWDFGGQEIYHATHQFFLTKRSLYLLLWNARKAKNYDYIYYWLHTIEAFGEDSPILLVMSKMNESNDDLNLKDLKSKFPQIANYLKIDSKDGSGISELTEVIRKTAWNLPLMRTKWVDSWFEVRQKLEDLGENWVNYDNFYNVCRSKGLDNEGITVLDDYLSDLGVILHFKDRLTLKDIVILKPEWATNAFYKILSAKFVLDNEGVLLQSELSHIWDMKTYPPSVHSQLMELMNKFELAYELPDKSSYLVAELLPKNEPDFKWDEKDNLCFYYCYDYFLPPGIITRFIVRMHKNIEKKENDMPLCWREGVVLNLQNSRALVKMKPDEREIEIKIKGDNKRGAIGAICDQFDQINVSIKKIKVDKKIPCNCSEHCPERHSYEDLLKAEKAGIKSIQCHKSYEDRAVSLLLDGYIRKEERREKTLKIINNYGGVNMYNENIEVNNVVGQVNIKSQLDHVAHIVKNAPAIPDTQKYELATLIEELKKALEPAACTRSDDTERVIEEAERVAKEVSRGKPNKSRLVSITEDLKETAKAVEDIAPAVLTVATKIASFVTGIF